ncbi:MAG: DNA oxidative demethylase AlkB [Gammaproteobacteria bacterium]|nr:DNA oxidative demethylase AlkB [Gammaproteobacteria bacterium]MBV9621277.1 DNA oxidative demethylase AlkB [Gammaproteobacteria bacterium]
MRTADLFDTEDPQRAALAAGAVLLRGFALPVAQGLHAALHAILAQAPLRHMCTRGGFRMSVAMSNCGEWGWVSDRTGYRYTGLDPQTRHPWPGLPACFAELAQHAAAAAGYAGFEPNACLINRYAPGARLTLHQDRNESDLAHPIVSVSLGLPAVFQFGGTSRAQRTQRIPLRHGDVAVWGGASRLAYHGVLPLKDGAHPLTGPCRLNLTLRRACG